MRPTQLKQAVSGVTTVRYRPCGTAQTVGNHNAPPRSESEDDNDVPLGLNNQEPDADDAPDDPLSGVRVLVTLEP